MCKQCEDRIEIATLCERCSEPALCSDLRLPSRTVFLCKGCMKAMEETVLGLVDSYDPEASTIYIQLGCDEVRRLRDEAAYGMIPPMVMLTMDQQEYIYSLLFDTKITDWDLGLSDEPSQ